MVQMVNLCVPVEIEQSVALVNVSVSRGVVVFMP